jgi:acetyl-CoA C-acetyltransferase
MNKTLRPVAILGGVRTPFVKSFTHYQKIGNQEMLTSCLKILVDRYNLKNQILGDVALGALITHAADWNLAREAVLGSGLHPETPGYNVQRACGTGLETTWHIALKIAAGQMEVGIAGGSDTNSDVPVSFRREFAWKLIEAQSAKSLADRLKVFARLRPADLKPQILGVREPRTGLSMGEHCEQMVKEWQISRTAQDQLAFESHQKAANAYASGFYEDLLIDFRGLKKDPLVRPDTTPEKLKKLSPAFDKSGQGTLTAGNSTPLTDGASVVLLSSVEYAQKKNLPVLAHFIDAEVAAVDFVGMAEKPEGLLMAPAKAVGRLLSRNQIKLQDFDFYEIHEAFAGQVLCTLKAWESDSYCQEKLGRSALGSIDRSKLNVKGGSLALGHPFAATGARIVASLAKTLSQNKKGRGLISICTAGGMGVAAIVERP